MLLSLGGRRRATRTGSSSTDRQSAFCHIEVQPAVASHNADERNQPLQGLSCPHSGYAEEGKDRVCGKGQCGIPVPNSFVTLARTYFAPATAVILPSGDVRGPTIARHQGSSSRQASASGLRSEALTAALPPLAADETCRVSCCPFRWILGLTFFDVDGFPPWSQARKSKF